MGYSSLGSGPDRTLIEHWNGTSWKHVPSPSPGGPASYNALTGIVAASARSVWAVGQYFVGANARSLIEHWNGASWVHVPSANLGSYDQLWAVAASSPGSIWAAGLYNNGTGTSDMTLALHCC